MSTESYFINLIIEEETANKLLEKYKQNQIFQDFFDFSLYDKEINSEYSTSIYSVFDNFLPANILIFKFLSNIDSPIVLETKGTKLAFDFQTEEDFVCCMIKLWKENIKNCYSSLGVICINYKKYYKIRNKLKKKYYKKLSD